MEGKIEETEGYFRNLKVSPHLKYSSLPFLVFLFVCLFSSYEAQLSEPLT